MDRLEGEGFALRHWRDDDLDGLAAMNGDPVGMEHFPSLVNRVATQAMIVRQREAFVETGMGLWVVEAEGRFAGFVGLQIVATDSPINGQIEVGWRLARWAWGRGLATRGARLAIDDGRIRLDVGDIFATTSVFNGRSEAVMRRLGMRRRPDFDYVHPRFPDWVGAPHIVYELPRAPVGSFTPGGGTGPR